MAKVTEMFVRSQALLIKITKQSQLKLALAPALALDFEALMDPFSR